VLDVQLKLVAALKARGAAGATLDQLASAAASGDDETAFKILEHLAANVGSGVAKSPGKTPFDAVYRWVG